MQKSTAEGKSNHNTAGSAVVFLRPEDFFEHDPVR